MRLYQASTKLGYSIVREKLLYHLRWTEKNKKKKKKHTVNKLLEGAKAKAEPATRGTQETLNGAELDEEL